MQLNVLHQKQLGKFQIAKRNKGWCGNVRLNVNCTNEIAAYLQKVGIRLAAFDGVNLRQPP